MQPLTFVQVWEFPFPCTVRILLGLGFVVGVWWFGLQAKFKTLGAIDAGKRQIHAFSKSTLTSRWVGHVTGFGFCSVLFVRGLGKTGVRALGVELRADLGL